MSLLLIAFISIVSIILGKLLFKKWINHLTLYCFIMGGLLFLYELRLLYYVDIVPLAWFFFASSFLAFFLGCITIICAKNLYSRQKIFSKNSVVSLPIFADGGKALKYSLIFFSIVGLFAAVQRWYVLITMYGSIPAVLVNAYAVYSLKTHTDVKEFIPILPAFIYVAIFLSGIYTAYKGKFSFLTFFPFIIIVIKQMTDFGRAELLLTLMEFTFTFLLFRNLLNTDLTQRYKFSRKNAVIASILLVILLISTASFIRMTRGTSENYRGPSKELKQLDESVIFTPSIYLYLSSDAGVFSKYIELEKEEVMFGENTFYIGYVFLSYLGVMERPDFLPKGYFIPMWSNTGTYLREIHADFGVVGVFLFPYLIGLLISWLWFKFYEEKNLIIFSFLVYLFLIVGFSFLTLVTKLNQWYISLLMIVFFLPVLEKIANKKIALK